MKIYTPKMMEMFRIIDAIHSVLYIMLIRRLEQIYNESEREKALLT